MAALSRYEVTLHTYRVAETNLAESSRAIALNAAHSSSDHRAQHFASFAAIPLTSCARVVSPMAWRGRLAQNDAPRRLRGASVLKQRTAVRLGALVVSAMMLAVQVETGLAATPISIYGAWHCGNDFCTWGERAQHDRVRREEPLADRPRRRPAVGQPRRAELRASAAAAEQDHRRADAQRRAARHDAGRSSTTSRAGTSA